MTAARSGKRKVGRRACMLCKLKKLKCDGNYPCGRCAKLGVPSECGYEVDRRKCRAYGSDGTKAYVFKSSPFSSQHPSEGCFKNEATVHHLSEHKIETSPDPLSKSIQDATLSFNERKDSEYNMWNFKPMVFNFNNFNLQDVGFDDFLRVFDDVDPFSTEDGSDQFPFAEPAELPLGAPFGNDNKESRLERSDLIEILFQSDYHAPPGISKDHLLDLERRHENLQDDSADSNDIFLLSTTLCLGALTSHKRELLRTRNEGFVSRSSIPDRAARAFNYYTIAKNLIPDVLLHSSIDGFCGLVLMANFMTMMVSLEEQFYLSANALQIAVTLRLHEREKFNELVKINSHNIGLFFLFWNIWCSSCMLGSFLGVKPTLPLADIGIPLPFDMAVTGNLSSLSLKFMQLRIQIASLLTKISRYYIEDHMTTATFMGLEEELHDISNQVAKLKCLPILDEHTYHRSRLLILELVSMESQVALLLYRSNLLCKRSFEAVHTAKKIVYEIWSHYSKQFEKNERDLINHLDWNFSYPLRTAFLTLWIACIVLRKYQRLLSFLQDDNLTEYTLAIEVLQDLVKLLPVHQNLLNLITSLGEAGKPHSLGPDRSSHFWMSLLTEP